MKVNCTEGQVCANMSCDLSSIAQTCRYMTLLDKVGGLWGDDQHQNRSNSKEIPLWLGEIFSRGYPNNNTRDELMDIVEKYACIKCTLPESHDGSIECVNNFIKAIMY